MPELRSDIAFSLPWAMTQHLPFRGQVLATRKAGFAEMSLRPFVIARTLAEGLTLAEMAAILADEGIRVGRIDPITAWVPDWRAVNFDLDFNVTTAFDPLAVFDLCAHFGARHVSLNAMWPVGRYDHDGIVRHYAALCDRAAPYGVTCDIEPIPMWGIRGIDEAMGIIVDSGAANAGLVLDITHFVRAGTGFEQLRAIPGELIRTVQICDGVLPRPADLSLERECFDRAWPGEGNFPITEILAVLDQIGGLTNVGPEVFSSSYLPDVAPPEEIGRRARESMLLYPQLRA